MPFDEKLADSIRKQLRDQPGLVEKKMFGGVAFLLNGNMSVGVHKSELIVRLPPEETETAVGEPGARIFDITGRPMKGWLLIGGAGVNEPAFLKRWVRRGVDYASSLPSKAKAKRTL